MVFHYINCCVSDPPGTKTQPQSDVTKDDVTEAAVWDAWVCHVTQSLAWDGAPRLVIRRQTRIGYIYNCPIEQWNVRILKKLCGMAYVSFSCLAGLRQ